MSEQHWSAQKKQGIYSLTNSNRRNTTTDDTNLIAELSYRISTISIIAVEHR